MMDIADSNTTLINSYFTLLKSLSANNKLELISKLSKSLKTEHKEKNNSWKLLFGALEIDQSSDEFVESLKKDRNFNRKTIEF